jgi:hypothetical protein
MKIKDFLEKNRETIGTAVAVGSALAGAAAGYNEFVQWPVGADSARAATNTMSPYALAAAVGLGVRYGGTGSNYLQRLGRAVSVASPAVMAYFMNDGNYDPALDLGPVLGPALGEILNHSGNVMEETDLGRKYLDENTPSFDTREGTAVDFIEELPIEELERFIGQQKRRGR